MKRKLLTCLSILSISTMIFAQTTFESKVIIDSSTGDSPYAIDSGLLDNDAFVDIVIGTDGGNTVEWYRNNGDGTFDTPITLVATGAEALLYVEGVHIADLDGINGNDILATSYGNANLVWFANNGDGTFANAVTIGTGLTGAGQVTTGYIDGGTTLDVAVVAYDSDSVVWYSNNGSGVFTGPNTIASVASSGPGGIDLTDYDGDGDLDAVIAFTDSGTIEVYDNNLLPSGAGTVSFTKYLNTVSSGNGYLFDIEVKDVNDDGTLDILKSDNNPSGGSANIAYYTKNSSGTATTFQPTTITTSITRTSLVKVADFDNDAKNDLIVTSDRATQPQDVIWFESNDSGGFSSEIPLDNTQSSIFGMTINDFDNDGDLDFATISYYQNDLNWFENKLITLDVEENTIQEITMYPNPTSNSLHFKGNIAGDLNVSVYNVLGKRVINNVVKLGQSLDVSKLNNGVYIIKFNDYNTTYKFVKQ